ncbi:MAG: hypothetical protein BGO77_02365 [Caedibacter sp. 37-49]|nr:MAG: hypothetical protein BGO77_02365 [Caedibacter sp. 37-49]
MISKNKKVLMYLGVVTFFIYRLEANILFIDELEGSNLVGSKNFGISNSPKYEWEKYKPQGLLRNKKINTEEYFMELQPELLETILISNKMLFLRNHT